MIDPELERLLIEAGFGNWLKNAAQNTASGALVKGKNLAGLAGNGFLSPFSQRAQGKVDTQLVANQVRNDWSRYQGQMGHKPTLNSLMDFVANNYGQNIAQVVRDVVLGQGSKGKPQLSAPSQTQQASNTAQPPTPPTSPVTPPPSNNNNPPSPPAPSNSNNQMAATAPANSNGMRPQAAASNGNFVPKVAAGNTGGSTPIRSGSASIQQPSSAKPSPKAAKQNGYYADSPTPPPAKQTMYQIQQGLGTNTTPTYIMNLVNILLKQANPQGGATQDEVKSFLRSLKTPENLKKVPGLANVAENDKRLALKISSYLVENFVNSRVGMAIALSQFLTEAPLNLQPIPGQNGTMGDAPPEASNTNAKPEPAPVPADAAPAPAPVKKAQAPAAPQSVYDKVLNPAQLNNALNAIARLLLGSGQATIHDQKRKPFSQKGLVNYGDEYLRDKPQVTSGETASANHPQQSQPHPNQQTSSSTPVQSGNGGGVAAAGAAGALTGALTGAAANKTPAAKAPKKAVPNEDFTSAVRDALTTLVRNRNDLTQDQANKVLDDIRLMGNDPARIQKRFNMRGNTYGNDWPAQAARAVQNVLVKYVNNQ